MPDQGSAPFTDDRLKYIRDDEYTCFNETHRRLADELLAARARITELANACARVSVLAYASDDGREYAHDRGIGDGHDACPACWAEDIRAALGGERNA